MRHGKNFYFTRREFLKVAGGATAALATAPLLGACGGGGAANEPIKIGVLLPYSDIYAVLGESITDAMKMYFDEVGNEAGGRQIEIITEDTEIKPDVAQQKARKLIEQDEVDFVTGVVSSGVLMGLRDYFVEAQKLLICSNAGVNAVSRGAKTPYIWRTSFTNWMAPWSIGGWAAENVGTRAVISVPDYAAGQDNINAFSNSYQAAGGEIVSVQKTPFPNMGDPAPFMAELADSGADLVYSFYSGGAAVTFVQAYSDFGLSGQLPLLCAGFMVEQDVLPAQGQAALGTYSSLHWAQLLDNPENQTFTAAFQEKVGREADVFAVQGYDTARVIVEMLNAVQGDTTNVDNMIESLSGISFASPRGPFTLDPNSQAPKHNMYLREVQEVDGALNNVVIDNFGEIVDPGTDDLG
ncbi:MAG: ABC transporter substrate-binding protein [Anaerolineae bacterium]|nr:ABC transporter substrate-binding protein [Anaerolineae bacterium]